MEARRTGPVVEWVIEEDARRILLSSPPGTVCERSTSSCRFGATARGQVLGMESPLLSLSVRDAKQEMMTAETMGRLHEAGCQSLVSPPPPLSLPVRDASGGRRPQRRRSDGMRPGAGDGVSPPLAPSQGCEAGDDDRRDDGATARGRAPEFRFPLLSLPVRDVSRGRQWRYHEGTRGTNTVGVF